VSEPVRGRAWLPFLAGFVAIWGVLYAIGSVDPSGRLGLLGLAVTLAAAALVEVFLHDCAWRAVPARLGLGRPAGRSLVAGALVAGAVAFVYPLFTLVSGESVQLRSSWPWVLIGLYAYHGLAEELAWRGYAFRRLRAGRSFWGAVAWTMPLIAATHVPIVVSHGAAIGAGAMAVAAVTTMPFAHLYELGRGTIWAPALVHTAIDSFKLVLIPASTTMLFSFVLIAVSLTVPLLAFAWSRGGRERATAV
jgi:membrane protease YdiL (CAAX protease family)